MSRLVNGLLALVGAYLVIFYGLWPGDPIKPVFSLPLPPGWPPDPSSVAALSIVVAAVALLVGVVGLVRGTGVVSSLLLVMVGAYLLVLRVLWPGEPLSATEVATPPSPIVVWLSLVVGGVAIVAGIVGVVRGPSAQAS